MKNILIQYLWIFSVTAALLVVALLLFPKKEDKLDYILKEVEKVQEEQKILTEKEKELKKLSDDKSWEQLDTDTVIIPPPKPTK